jgi:hypothetical protein
MSEGAGGIGRSIGAVLAGVVVAVLCVMAIESLGQRIYPPPPGMEPSNIESVRAAMKNIPTGALLFLLAAWLLGTVAGSAVAARIARQRPVLHAMIVGVVQLAFGVFNLVMFPHPLWFVVAGMALILPAAYLGATMAVRT